MYYQPLTDDEIICGFRRGDPYIIREYFYGYCRTGYHIFNQRYQLDGKDNLDFMSLAHQYALYLMEHDWKPLEDHSQNVSLRTWLINGFRYVVLDALKWYRREYGSITYEDYLKSFDVTDNLRLQFNRMVEDVCDHAVNSREDRLIIDMMLRQGFKGKEIATQMGMTPSAISQRFKKLKEKVIIPYFRKNFDMNMDTTELMEERTAPDFPAMEPCACGSMAPEMEDTPIRYYRTSRKRTTPDFVTELQPDEIFVFGSNLKGMHGGGAAYTAYRRFGAIMGQAVGLQGRSYAIPTMQGGVETIRPYVNDFIGFARQHPELSFLVTRIGCGMAGFTDEEISPLFSETHNLNNIILPKGW